MSMWRRAPTNAHHYDRDHSDPCLPEDFPVYSVLKIAQRVKITLLIIKFFRSAN